MGFHTESELRQLGKDVAEAAHHAVLRQEQIYNSQLGAPGVVIEAKRDFYSHFPELYASFTTPNPSGMQQALDTLGKMAFSLTHQFPVPKPVGGDAEASGADSSTVPAPAAAIGDLGKNDTPDTIVGNVADDIRQWTGPARDAFQRNVLANFPERSQNQVVAINALAVALAMHMNLRKKLNENVWDIGQKSIEAFKKAGTLSVGQGVQITLMVAVAAATVWTVWGSAAVAYAAAEGSVAAGLAAVTAKDAASIVTGFNNIGKTASDVSAKNFDHSSAEHVAASMKGFLADVAKSYRDQEKQVIDAMSQLADGLKNNSALFELAACPEVLALSDDDISKLEPQFTTGR